MYVGDGVLAEMSLQAREVPSTVVVCEQYGEKRDGEVERRKVVERG